MFDIEIGGVYSLNQERAGEKMKISRTRGTSKRRQRNP
jgi:hypothetical protein